MSSLEQSPTSRLPAALRAVANDWYVFPLMPGTKVPMTAHGQHDATRHLPTIHAWWEAAPDANVAIACEPSGLYVIDLDMRHSVDGIGNWSELVAAHISALPPEGVLTYMVRTPSGGRHLYYRSPAGRKLRNTAGRLAPGIDTRGPGYVVAAGSATEEGAYVATGSQVEPAVVAPLPDWILPLLDAQTEVTSKASPSSPIPFDLPSTSLPRASADETLARVRQLATELSQAPEGQGNVTAARVAYMAGQYVGAEQIDQRLACEVLRAGLQDWTWRCATDAEAMSRTIASQVRAGMKVPRYWAASGATSAPVTPSPPPTPPAPASSASAQAASAAPEQAVLAHLPQEFWRRRVALTRIYVAAAATRISPDALLGAVLATLSGFVPPKVVVETGTGSASLNCFTILVGHSGTGKSKAERTGRRLFPCPSSSQCPGLPDNLALPVGSGEGMAEAYYGMEPQETGEVYQSGPRKGEPKTVLARRKIYDHATFYLDEGETLLRFVQRAGSTIMTEIRKAWVGGTLGQANASAERRRIVPEGTYALGLVVSFQPETIGPLFDDAAGGTPQRFLYLNAALPSGTPSPRPSWPGMFNNVGHMLPIEPMALPFEATAILDEWLDVHGQADADPGLDSHWPLHMTKLSGLLTILDSRTEITMDDWSLAEQIYRVSATNRDALLAVGRNAAARRAAAEDARRAAVISTGIGTGNADASRRALAVARVGRQLARLVHEQGVTLVRGRGQAVYRLAARDRPYVEEGLSYAEAQGWIVRAGEEGEQLSPAAKPPSR